jgi:glycerol-3-phosphate dehydrogenase
MIEKLVSTPQWDVGIIGGGATGLGIAVDAASRGLKTVLFEQHDFAKGTSSRSTKLVHGGVRYLQQGNVKLVLEALKERGLLLRNAPHLVHNQKFVVPNYKWWEGPFYGIGLKIYDWMAGKLGLGPSEFLSKEETLLLLPNLDPEGLRGSVIYHDGQFDDARLAIDLAKTAAQYGAVLVNYFPVTGFIRSGGKLTGIRAKDQFTQQELESTCRVVINATGVFTDTLMNLDEPGHQAMVAPSQGVHLVVDKEFLPGDTAILIPRTDDGRVLFAVPWHDKIVLGTTDTPITTRDPAYLLEPVPMEEEINFILQHIGRYLSRDPQREDIRSMFAGLRPLVRGGSKKTAALSRDHVIHVSPSGLISITGGKWTTYRKMAEDAVNLAITKSELQANPCITEDLKLFGHDQPPLPADVFQLEDEELKNLVKKTVDSEMCMTVEDFLSRRTRSLLLDARASLAIAPKVANLMAAALGKDEVWIREQIGSFNSLAKNYLPV